MLGLFDGKYGFQTTSVYNVNPGLINHGLLIWGYSRNSHDLILKWYLPNEKTAVFLGLFT